MWIVSWNCGGWSCGGFTDQKIKVIISKFNPDILTVQECTQKEFDALQYDYASKDWYGDEREVSYKGIAIFSKSYKIKRFETMNPDFRYVVPYQINISTAKEFTLFSVWTKNLIKDSGYEEIKSYEYQENVIQAMDWYHNKITGSQLVIGDFNTGRSNNPNNEQRYKHLLSEMGKQGFFDCFNKDTPTFYWYFSKQKPYQNDYCFASENLHGKIDVTIGDCKDWISPGLSDHCPIIVEFDF